MLGRGSLIPRSYFFAYGGKNSLVNCLFHFHSLQKMFILMPWCHGSCAIEHFHVTSQSHENHTGGHFGVQLNGDLVCCKLRMQNTVQTWQLMDLPHKYVRYRYPVHVICETWVHWLLSSRLSHASSYLLVHQDGRHVQKYHGVMQTYITFNHVMKTFYYWGTW